MNKMIIMAGLPGAGKSYIRKKLFRDYYVVDCDELKKTLPNYDPENPRALHDESKLLEKYEISKCLVNKISFVYDTTASNTDKIVELTKQAQTIGYFVSIVYVKVSLATALARNSKRHRVVPDDVILDKYSKLSTSLDIIKSFANDFVIIDNEKDCEPIPVENVE